MEFWKFWAEVNRADFYQNSKFPRRMAVYKEVPYFSVATTHLAFLILVKIGSFNFRPKFPDFVI